MLAVAQENHLAITWILRGETEVFMKPQMLPTHKPTRSFGTHPHCQPTPSGEGERASGIDW